MDKNSKYMPAVQKKKIQFKTELWKGYKTCKPIFDWYKFNIYKLKLDAVQMWRIKQHQFVMLMTKGFTSPNF